MDTNILYIYVYANTQTLESFSGLYWEVLRILWGQPFRVGFVGFLRFHDYQGFNPVMKLLTHMRPIWRIWISQEIIYMYRRFLHRHMFCSCVSAKDADACLENDARYCFLCSDVFLSWAVVLNCCCWQQGRRIFIPLPGTVPSHDGGTGGGLQARQRKELAGWVSAQTFSATLSLQIRHSITTCLNGVFA
jgi:hypothetical protein